MPRARSRRWTVENSFSEMVDLDQHLVHAEPLSKSAVGAPLQLRRFVPSCGRTRPRERLGRPCPGGEQALASASTLAYPAGQGRSSEYVAVAPRLAPPGIVTSPSCAIGTEPGPEDARRNRLGPASGVYARGTPIISGHLRWAVTRLRE